MKTALPAVVTALCLVLGCGNDEPLDSARVPAAAETGAAPSQTADTPKFTKAPLVIVDLEGRPLPNMLPIATDSPNAFQSPAAQGELTGANGTSVLLLPRDVHLYVRAWDPALRMFPNNFYEVLPPTGTTTETMTITMVASAALAMTLLDAAHDPVANENVGMMMFHGVHGPWWPGEGDTDDRGRVVFEPVPPGEYTVKIKTLESGALEMGGVRLAPGGKTELGPVLLQ